MNDDNQFPEAIPVTQEAQQTAQEGSDQQADEPERKHTTRRSRGRRKPTEQTTDQLVDEATGQNGHAESLAEGEIPGQERQWIKRFGFWRDNEAGVRIEEDRQNKLHTIIARAPLPAKAIELLEERGWERDREGGGYSRKISHLRPAESREMAEQTALDVANVVRGELGLEERASFYISRC